MQQPLEADILKQYTDIDETDIDRMLADEIEASSMKIVVLDDDPTGVQTVHDVSVYTSWDEESIRAGFAEDNRVFYLLTNSRGMTKNETEQVHRDIAGTIARIAADTGQAYLLMSRSDSTLRGHYPLETETLREVLEKEGFQIDGEVICPFFPEGGRYTMDNVHYVQQGDLLVPAAQTEFARDKTFGYVHSSIPAYIEEKTEGRYRADDVLCISLAQLREADIDGIVQQLSSVTDFGKICVNAVSYTDLKVFCIALYRAVRHGRRFLFRTAAGLVKIAAGISDRALLTRADMVTDETAHGGVVVVGSHTEKTTRQLEQLLALPQTEAVEFNSDLVLEGAEAFDAEIRRCIAEEERIAASGKTAVCYTSRKLLTLEGDTPEEALRRSVQISDGVQRLVGQLGITPAFVIAKGGITSSDIGTKALRVKKANVLGQIQPGIPVWQTGEESTFPGMPYVIFPGNTGDDTTLRTAVSILTADKTDETVQIPAE